MSLQQVELSDVCTLLTDGTHYTPPDIGEGIPFLTVKDVSEKGLDFEGCSKISIEEYTKADLGNSAPKVGDVLFSKDGTVGKVHVVSESKDFAVLSSLAILRPFDGLDSNYLAHVMRNPITLRQANKNKTGSALRRIILSDIKKLKIPLPPLEEQKRIAAILDKADSVRLKRQQAIDLADDFLRSVFLDMFGDPVTNPKGFPLSILSDFYIDPKNGTKCGPFGSALKKHEYVEDGVPVWNMDNISLNGKFTDSPRLWITESKYVDLEAYSVEDGDVIISRAGTVGKMGVVRSKSEHSIISTNLIRVRLGEKLRPEYFVNLMNYCKGRVGRLKTGPDGAFTHMNTGILDKLEFPYPPIELQDKFMEIKEKVISSMEKSEKNEIENLFNSLSQKAFAGEL